jgi:hypothetical protein
MNIVKTIEQFNPNNVYFLEPIKNNIMNNSNFIRIIYSTSSFVLNGVFLLVKLDTVVIEKYFNKLKCLFNINECQNLINQLKNIEETILNRVSTNKIKKYKISQQISSGIIRIFLNDTNKYNKLNCLSQDHIMTTMYDNSFILKISGLWETESEIGITYKFIKL